MTPPQVGVMGIKGHPNSMPIIITILVANHLNEETTIMDETTPLNADKTKHQRFVITRRSSEEKMTKSAKNTENPTLIKRRSRQRLSGEYGLQARRELALIDSLRIPKEAQETVHRLLNDAFMRSQLTCVLLAFCIIEQQEIEAVSEPEKWEQDKRLYAEDDFSQDKLTLAVLPFPQYHQLIGSLLRYLQHEMQSPMHVIISRRRVVLQCSPQSTHSTWWKRFLPFEREARYYKIMVDFTQSEPMCELK